MDKAVLVFFLIVSTFPHVDAQINSENFTLLKKAFLNDPANYSKYANLHFLLSTQYESLTAGQRKEIRSALDSKSNFSKIKISLPRERGERIVIKGIVADKNGKPVAGAKITIFQTDAKGYYAPTDSILRQMNEPDPRLFGVLRTDRLGQYEISTIRPASYPTKYEGRFIPQHIHFNISVAGQPELKLQVVFEDDPAMKDVHWRKWAKELHFPIVTLVPGTGIKTGTCNITIGNE